MVYMHAYNKKVYKLWKITPSEITGLIVIN